MVLGTAEAREVAEAQGSLTAQLPAGLGGLLRLLPAVRALAPAPAVNRVPRVLETDLQLALAH